MKIIPAELNKKNLKKYIFVGHDPKWGHYFLLSGYRSYFFGYYAALIKEAINDFPDINIKNIICSRVLSSKEMKGFPLIHFIRQKTDKYPSEWEVLNSRINFDF